MASPVIDNVSPADGQTQVAPVAQVHFDITDADGDLDETATIIMVDGVTVYANSVALTGWVVIKNALALGFEYSVSTLRGTWPYLTQVVFEVFAQDAVANLTTASLAFTVDRDLSCFDASTSPGGPTVFELSLMVPYTSSTYVETERLRQELLGALLNTGDPGTAYQATRYARLLAHETELAPVMRDLVPPLTASEHAVYLCYTANLITIAAALRSKAFTIERVVTELRGKGLTQEHAEMFQRYEDYQDAFTYVAVYCVLICLAKALEQPTVL